MTVNHALTEYNNPHCPLSPTTDHQAGWFVFVHAYVLGSIPTNLNQG
jgi:hypothetical protein